MKKSILIGLCLLSAAELFAQNAYTFKVYQNTDIFQVDYWIMGNTYDTKKYNNFNRISFAISKKHVKSILTQELELWIPEFRKHSADLQFPRNYTFRKRNDFKELGSSWLVRYEASFKLVETGGFNVSAGAGINPYYVKLESLPQVQNAFYLYTKYYGFTLNVIPRFSYTFSKNFGIEINVPLNIYDFRREKTYINNPQLPEDQKSCKHSENIFFENAYTIRFGVCYTIMCYKKNPPRY